MPRPRNRRQFGFRVATVAGVDVFIDPSMLIVFSLIVFSLGAGVYPAQHPDWSSTVQWTTALVAATLFFVSVLLHELSHALVGRAHGIRIRAVTLFVFGGVAHLPREPHAWRAELVMAIAGPIMSLVLGTLFLFLGALAADPSALDPAKPEQFLRALDPLSTALVWLGSVNLLLAFFNLVPGFPLDGGRVLRAILWGITNDLRAATRWASRLGQGFAWLLMIVGIGMMLGFRVPIFGSGVVNGLWIAFIGWFLNNAAVLSYRQLVVHEALEDVPVSRLMLRGVDTVGPEMRLDELVDEHLMQRAQRVFPVTDQGRLIGLVCLQDIRKVAREKRAGTAVRDVMTPSDRLTTLGPDEDAVEGMERLSRLGVNQLPVTDRGVLVGLFRREDLIKWLSLHEDEPAVHHS